MFLSIFASNLRDVYKRQGGLREAASVVRVDVSRRIKNPRSTADNDTIGRIYTFRCV